MSVRNIVRVSTLGLVLALASAPAFAWGGGGGGHPVPEPSTLALLGIAIPGAAAWIKRKLS